MESPRVAARSIDMRRYAKLALVALAIGGCVLVYRGPGRPFIRGHVGDVGATMLVYALLGMVLRLRPPWLAVAAMAIATAIEVGQLFWSGSGVAGELVVGSTFDGWDFAAYSVGTVIALVWDVSYHRRRGPNEH